MTFADPPSRRPPLLITLALGIAVLLVVGTAGRWWPSESPAVANPASSQASVAMRVGSAPRAISKRTMTVAEAIVSGRPIQLNESDAVINVVPQAFLDLGGGFLVTDEREAQLRSYAADGSLRWHAGRKGGGPGEFRSVAGAARLGTGEVAAVDRDGRVTLFGGAGEGVIHTVETELLQITDVSVAHDTLLLLAAVSGGKLEGPRIHLVHPRTGEILHQFFAPFAGSPNESAATVGGFTRFDVRGDSIAAIFGVSDTVYVFTIDGNAVRQFPIRAELLRPVPRGGPPTGTQMERFAWLTTFDLIADVHWLSDGFAIAYQSVLPGTSFEREWHLLTVSSTGEPRVEVPRTPRLLAVDPDRGALYFVDPDSETPDRWIEARLRG